MNQARAEEFKVRLPDGWLAERLPVGAGAGRWWVAVVFSGVTVDEAPAVDPLENWAQLHRGLRDRIRFTGVGASLDLVNGGASRDDDVIDVRWEFTQNGVTGLEVEYLHEGVPVAREAIDLLH